MLDSEEEDKKVAFEQRVVVGVIELGLSLVMKEIALIQETIRTSTKRTCST